MLTKLHCATISGLTVHPVELELDAAPGLPAWEIVGLPDAVVKESKERVRTAIRNSGYEFPARKIVVNLAPAQLRKEGAALDLALAIAILTVTNQIHCRDLPQYLFVSELGLDGTLRPVKGILPISSHFRDKNVALIVAQANSRESSIGGCTTYAFETLQQVMHFLEHPETASPIKPSLEEWTFLLQKTMPPVSQDFANVKGQTEAKRALEIAAAGNHNILMIGSPGAGKTMLSEALAGILPPISLEESLSASTVYSIAGLLPPDAPLLSMRPFRNPHHTVTTTGMIGGGRLPRPGEISLAHHGVLFLDELPEFKKEVLEALRQPLENGTVTISRLHGQVTFPCRFLLVASMNPCPCGYATDRTRPCTCTPGQIHAYRNRLSGPLLDRFDLQIDIQPVQFRELYQQELPESSATVGTRVLKAREIQIQRFQQSTTLNNSEMTDTQLLQFCRLETREKAFLETAFQKLGFSARAHSRVLKVARTIADLDGSERIQMHHLAEAIQYRTTDRSTWMQQNVLPQ